MGRELPAAEECEVFFLRIFHFHQSQILRNFDSHKFDDFQADLAIVFASREVEGAHMPALLGLIEPESSIISKLFEEGRRGEVVAERGVGYERGCREGG